MSQELGVFRGMDLKALPDEDKSYSVGSIRGIGVRPNKEESYRT